MVVAAVAGGEVEHHVDFTFPLASVLLRACCAACSAASFKCFSMYVWYIGCMTCEGREQELHPPCNLPARCKTRDDQK